MKPLVFVDNHRANPARTKTPGVQFSSACGRWKVVSVGATPVNRDGRWYAEGAPTQWHLYEHDPPVPPGTMTEQTVTSTRRRLRWLKFPTPAHAGFAASVLHNAPTSVGEARAVLAGLAHAVRQVASDKATALAQAGVDRIVDAAHGVARWLREASAGDPVRDDDLMRD